MRSAMLALLFTVGAVVGFVGNLLLGWLQRRADRLVPWVLLRWAILVFAAVVVFVLPALAFGVDPGSTDYWQALVYAAGVLVGALGFSIVTRRRANR